MKDDQEYLEARALAQDLAYLLRRVDGATVLDLDAAAEKILERDRLREIPPIAVGEVEKIAARGIVESMASAFGVTRTDGKEDCIAAIAEAIARVVQIRTIALKQALSHLAQKDEGCKGCKRYDAIERARGVREAPCIWCSRFHADLYSAAAPKEEPK